MTTPKRDVPRRQLGGPDPLDRRLRVERPSAATWLLALLRRRSALGLAPSLTPAIVFLPLGAVLGPGALGLIPARLFGYLDAGVTLALAVLGVIVGVALGREMRTSARLLLAAGIEGAVTFVAVAAAAAYFAAATGLPLAAPFVPLVLAIGLCASVSSATSADPDSEPAAGIATRVADLDDVLPIALTTVVFALVPSVSAQEAWLYAVAPAWIGLAVGAVGWLLFDRAESGPERIVFVLGVLALAGGAAAYLGVSPLAVGLVAGLVWTLAPGRADHIVRTDLAKVQHPLVVLLLVTAGAQWVPSMAAVWLLAPYLLFRLAGKVAGAWFGAPVADVRPSDLAAFLMPPGVVAVALALNFRQMLPTPAGEMVLSVVAVGTAAFEIFALAVVPRWRRGAGR